jgi:polysaccharide biosynthesis transport protein
MSSSVQAGLPVNENHLSPPALRESGYVAFDHREPPEQDGPAVWTIIRRHLVLVCACALTATVAAAFVVARLPRMFAATASVRIDQRLSQPTALNGIGISESNVLATELEMLRSRQLAQEVSDSVGYRLRVLAPTNVSRTKLFSRVTIAHDATPGSLRLVARDTAYALLNETGDVLVDGIVPGRHVVRDGVAFDLAPTASEHPSIELQVLPLDAATETLEDAIQVSRRNRDADVVDVTVRDPDPVLAQDLANTLVRRFIQGREGVKQLEARSAVEFLRGQIGRISTQLGDAERKLRDFREAQRIVSLPDEASTGVTRLAELQANRNTLEAERQALDRVFRDVSAKSATGTDAAYRQLLAFPTLLRTGMATDLVTALTAAEERRGELLTRRTERDPDVVLVNSRIAQLQQGIRSLVTTYLQGLTDQTAALDAQLSRSSAVLSTIPRKEIRLAELDRDAKGSEAIFTMLQSRLKEAEIAAASSDQSLPRTPVSPRPIPTLLLALCIGVMLGTSGAVLLDRGDRALHSRHELLAVTGMPVLGVIPRLTLRHGVSGFLAGVATRFSTKRVRARAGTASKSVPSRAGSDAESLFVFTEAVSRLAVNLSYLPIDSRPRVLLVTSALPGDGKTTVTTNLALALAHAGRRVLLIDADLRGGRIAAALALGVAPGLSEVLSGSVQAAHAAQIFRRLAEGAGVLHVITAGGPTTAPARLLASTRSAELISWARENYDIVLLDTPPVTSIADATVLAPLSDGVMLVARSGTTVRDAIEFAVEQLHIVRAPVLGGVLNDVDLRREGAYDSAYEFYGRYSPAALVT